MRHSILVFYVLLSCVTSAQQRQSIIVRKYTQKDGINSYNVRRVGEDEYGFIWVATQDGLSRYDGKNFVPYTKSADPRHRLCGVDIREIVPDKENHLLWVLPGEVGVNAINTLTGTVVKTIPIPYSNNEDWNICMARSHNRLWIGTFTGLKLYNTETSRFESLPALKGESAIPVEFEVRSIHIDSSGNTWVAYSGYGIVIYDRVTLKVKSRIKIDELNDHLRSGSIRFLSCVEPTAGTIIYATNQGLRMIGYGNSYQLHIDNAPSRSLAQLNTGAMDYIAVRENQLLVAGSTGLVRLDPDLKGYVTLKEHTGPSGSRWLDAVQSIFIDSRNDIWLGCQEGLGFINRKESPFDPYVYDDISHIKLDHVRTICPLPGSDILVGLIDGMVLIDGKSRSFRYCERGHLYHHIFQDGQRRIIASRPDGMFVYTGGKLTPIADVYPEFRNYTNNFINSHITISDSLTILGTESNSGILLWDPLHGRVRSIMKSAAANGLSSNIVNNIYRDSLRNLWVLSDNVITILSPGLDHSRELALPYKLFFDMCEAGGYYWIASYGSGIIQLDREFRVVRVINSGNGLTNDGVYQLYPVSGDRLLVTTNNGISLLDIHESGGKNYFALDGLHSNGFEEVCGAASGGLIYAGGLNGFTVIDPTKFDTNGTPPRFFFTAIRTQLRGRLLDTSNLSMVALTVPDNWLQTSISFSGLSYSRPESVRYQYRILQQDTSWISLGTRASLDLLGLPPGAYTLEVRAANEDGYWSAPSRMLLHFQPKWYETWWFKIGILLLAAALFYAFYRLRIGELRKQQAIRSGIASDLHDDIGSLLNSVKVFSHLARRSPDHEDHFQNIDESLTQATVGLRDMIWVLDNSEDTVYELIERIKKFALPVTAAYGIRLKFSLQLPETDIAISKTEKRNLLLMAKEAINNSIKYSECGVITVECSRSGRGVALRISDDGKGFDMDIPSSGNGLRNLKDRAVQIKYRCRIVSAPGAGTKIEIQKA